MIHYELTNLIKELKILLELLREKLTNLTTKPHAERDPKKNLQPQTNEAEDPPQKKNKDSNQIATNFWHPYYHNKTNNPWPKKLDKNVSPLLTPKRDLLGRRNLININHKSH